jgi:hypothetical protein
MKKLLQLVQTLNTLKTNKRMFYFLLLDEDGNICLACISNNSVEQNQPLGNLSDTDFAYSKLWKIVELAKITISKNKDGSNFKALFGEDL